MTGADVYRKLMDLALVLQDGEDMGTLYMFLSSIDANSPALAKLDSEISSFASRINSLVAAAKKVTPIA